MLRASLFVVVSLFATLMYSQNNLSLESIFLDKYFEMKTVPGFRFMNDGQQYTLLEGNNIFRYDLLTGARSGSILDSTQIPASYQISNYNFSENEACIILRSDTNRIYRHSYTAKYLIYNRLNSTLDSIDNLSDVSYVTMNSPGNKAAFVKGNNLYYQDMITEEVSPITMDGKVNRIINGHTDWVYEEEFGFTKAFEWSPDGNMIAFLRFDETEVPEVGLTYYENDLYPRNYNYKYPKVGESIAKVSVLVYDVNNSSTTTIDLGPDNNIYVPGIHWTEDNDLLIYCLNRHQNHISINKWLSATDSTYTMLEEENDAYIEVHNDLLFTSDGQYFFWQSERDGYNHLYLYDVNGRLIRQLTSGNWEVTNVYRYDDKRRVLYYQSNEGSTIDRGIYAVDTEGEKKVAVQTKSGHNHAQFSTTCDFYILTHSTANSPNTYKVFSAEGQLIRTIEDNGELLERKAAYHFSDIKLSTTRLSDTVELNTILIHPAEFDPAKTYPLLMYTYSGPGSQRVLNKWNSFRRLWWFQYLAQEGYFIVITDNRGTGGKGEDFKKMTYLQLGRYETEDQINAARHFGEFDHIDQTRIAVFGKSYGGYISSLSLLKGGDVFKMAIAAAPVTHWQWYDAIYTERYMRTVRENEKGYLENSPLNFANKLKGHYLLLHGLTDDNVHFQHTAEMAAQLQQNNKHFESQFYPNTDHALFKGDCYPIFKTMTNFIFENL